LKQHTPEDVAGGRALRVELSHDTQLDGMHAPKAFVGKVEDAPIRAASTILDVGDARGQKDPKIDVSSKAHDVHNAAPKETNDKPPKNTSRELSSASPIAEETKNNVSCTTPIAKGQIEQNWVSCTPPIGRHMEMWTKEKVSYTPPVVEGHIEKEAENIMSCTPAGVE